MRQRRFPHQEQCGPRPDAGIQGAHQDAGGDASEGRRPAQGLGGRISPTFTVGGDDAAKQVIFGGDVNVDPFDEAGDAFATVMSVIDASIAACRPQETANTSKAGRDRFWNELVMIWTGVGGAESLPARARQAAKGSAPGLALVWMRMRTPAAARPAATGSAPETRLVWSR